MRFLDLTSSRMFLDEDLPPLGVQVVRSVSLVPFLRRRSLARAFLENLSVMVRACALENVARAVPSVPIEPLPESLTAARPAPSAWTRTWALLPRFENALRSVKLAPLLSLPRTEPPGSTVAVVVFWLLPLLTSALPPTETSARLLSW